MKGRGREKEKKIKRRSILKMIKISKYLGQGKDNHTWGHSSLYQRFFRILEVKIEDTSTVF
jgi:hypothetical protein